MKIKTIVKMNTYKRGSEIRTWSC